MKKMVEMKKWKDEEPKAEFPYGAKKIVGDECWED